MSFQITCVEAADYGHRISHHESKCRNLHGHRGTVELTVSGDLVDDSGTDPQGGMVADFGDVRAILRGFLERNLDHHLVLWEHDAIIKSYFHIPVYAGTVVCHPVFGRVLIFAHPPTAERLAEWIYSQMGGLLRVQVDQVRFWETPNCSAIYPARHV